MGGKSQYNPEYHAAWYQRNKEKILKKVRAWREANKAEAKARESRYGTLNYERNREAILARKKAWAVANPEKVKAIRWRNRKKNGKKMDLASAARRTGLPRVVVAAIKSIGVCAICKEPGSCVDHDHATGSARGCLCRNCNLGVGNFRDNPARLRAAADYLEKHQQVLKLLG
jgi:hypothetical protein